MNSKERIEKLKKEREAITNRIYFMMVEVAAIFGMGAFGAYGIGLYLDFSKKGMLVVLGISFVVSWLFVALRYKSVTGKLTRVEADLKEALKARIGEADDATF